MRVVAGSAGGLSLLTPRKDIRPTMDKVRAAIFSSLGDVVPSAKVLDLFAGSGALGIEALSRGASMAVFVEQSREAAVCIQSNLKRCHLQGTIKIMDVFSFLDRETTSNTYDLIFADPPYRKHASDPALSQAVLNHGSIKQLLSPQGILVVEKYFQDDLQFFPNWQLLKTKRYGQTDICFLQLVIQ